MQATVHAPSTGFSRVQKNEIHEMIFFFNFQLPQVCSYSVDHGTFKWHVSAILWKVTYVGLQVKNIGVPKTT
jgi:hypothetical protein